MGVPGDTERTACDCGPVQSATRLLLELSTSYDGRLEGTVQSIGRSERSPFSGMLELMKVLEDAGRMASGLPGDGHEMEP